MKPILVNSCLIFLLFTIFMTTACSRRMYNEDPVKRVQRYNSGGFEVKANTDVNDSNMYKNLTVYGIVKLGDTNEKAINTSVTFRSRKEVIIGSTVTDLNGAFEMELSSSDFSGNIEFANGVHNYTIENIDMGQYFKVYKFKVKLPMRYVMDAVYIPLTKKERRQIKKMPKTAGKIRSSVKL